jgi:large conductance mechanosensitive channel
MRGNVVDLAVALIIGAAFGGIVTSFVNDILMPPIGLALKGVDFTNLFLSLTGQSYPSLAAAKAAGAPTLNYGVFLNTIVNFVIVAFAMFLLVRQVARFFPPPPPPASNTRECPYCLSAVPLKATRCAHCTSELARLEMTPPAPGRA